jgi:hypothetical protein
MCFYNDDYDWIARVVEHADTTATKQTKCDECGSTIPVGANMHTIHMAESEGGCVTCERGDCECADDCDSGERCQCETPNYGETFDYERCEGCEKFLRAVEASEVAAGCARHHAQPRLTEMTEEINEGGMCEAKRYFKTARAMFPELVTSGYLGMLWRKMFYIESKSVPSKV